MLTVAMARSWGACNTFFWIDHCCQRAGRGSSVSWRADSPACRLINLTLESSYLTLIRGLWVGWEDSLSTVTSLYNCLGLWLVRVAPCAWFSALSCRYATRLGGTDHVGHFLFCWSWLRTSTAYAPIFLPLIAAYYFALLHISHWSHFGLDIIMIWHGYLQNCKLPQTRIRRYLTFIRLQLLAVFHFPFRWAPLCFNSAVMQSFHNSIYHAMVAWFQWSSATYGLRTHILVPIN